MAKRKLWNEEDIKSALDSVEDGVSVYESSRIHGVPESTLRWRVKHGPEIIRGKKSHLTKDDENQIEKYAEFMSNIGQPCTVLWLRQLAGRLAQKR